MALQEKLLGQRNDVGTTPLTLVAGEAGFVIVVRTIIICNTSSTETSVTLYHSTQVDAGGNPIFNSSSELMHEYPFPESRTIVWDAFMPMDGASHYIGAKTSDNQASPDRITFTAYGVRIS